MGNYTFKCCCMDRRSGLRSGASKHRSKKIIMRLAWSASLRRKLFMEWLVLGKINKELDDCL